MTATLDYARRYVARGWHVMPVHSAPGGVCRCRDGAACRTPGKHPIPKNGHDDATTDDATVERWFKSGDNNIGAACAASRFIALDVDAPRPKNGNTDGRADLARLIEEHGPLPVTVAANTGGGALHLLFRDPGVETIGKLGKAIDVKRDGQIVVAPSIHASGNAYSWQAGRAPWEIPLAELPPEWVELLRRPEPPESKPVSSTAATGDDFFTALESLDQRYVLQCLSGTALVNGERFTFKKTKGGKHNLLVDRGDGWEATSNYIDSSGRIAARSTGRGADDGGPLASTWCRYYDRDDKAIYRALIESVPELAAFVAAREERARQIRDERPTLGDDHPNAPHVNGVPPADVAEHRTSPPTPTGLEDVPPPTDEPDADSGEDAPNAPTPWRGGDDGPLRMAYDFVSKYANHDDGPTLHKWKGDFHLWSPDLGCHAKLTDEQIEAKLFGKLHLKHPKDVNYVRDSLHGVDNVLIDHVEVGNWIGEPTVAHPALELAPCRNGLLHLPTRTRYDATPRFFNTAALATKFDPKAAWPKLWLAFLKEIYPDDDASIQLLQEWFGYLLTADTRQQKILLLIGKRRSGKGTIARVLTALLGRDSVCAPSLAQLGTNFGCWPLIGKIAAIIGDARLGGRSDIAAVVERLLNISGEDAQTIDRKHREPWTGYLSTRIMIVSNELPRFTDASDALSGRMLISKLTQSFYGKENPNLTSELLAELPGILLWAIEGWERLSKRGHFVQPPAWAHLIDNLEDLASPVRAWVREHCVRACDVKPDKAKLCITLCDPAFADFKAWCESQEQKIVPTKTRFGIDLGTIGDITMVRATADQVAILTSQNHGQEPKAKRPWIYSGLRLKTPDELDPPPDPEPDVSRVSTVLSI